MVRFCLVPLIGLPGSGKTTFSQILTARSNNPFHCAHICYDDLVKPGEIFFDDPLNLNFKNFRNSVLDLIRAIVAGKDAAYKFCVDHEMNILLDFFDGNGDIVILIDDNNYYRSMRYEFYKISKELRLGFVEIYFDCTLEWSLLHNLNRNALNVVPDFVIKRMALRLEPPNVKIDWERHAILINSSNFPQDVTSIVELIWQRVLNPVENPFQSLEPSCNNNNSMIHAIDLHLRAQINMKIKANSVHDTQLLASELNLKRKQLLSDLRKNVLNLPESVEQINEYF